MVASPLVSISSPSDGAIYALGAVVPADYLCKDLVGSMISACVGDQSIGGLVDTSQAGSHTFTVAAADRLFDFSTKTVSYTVVAPPSVSIVSPSDGASYLLGTSVPVDYSCRTQLHEPNGLTCAGDLPVGGAVDTSSVGPKTFTVVSRDGLVQSTTRTSSYRIIYPFGGFDSPVGSNGVVDAARAGQGVPLKFSLGGDRGLGVVSRVTWQQVSCIDGSNIGQPASGSGKLSYASSTGRYTELATTDPSWKGSCRTVTIQIADTTLHSVVVKFAH